VHSRYRFIGSYKSARYRRALITVTSRRQYEA